MLKKLMATAIIFVSSSVSAFQSTELPVLPALELPKFANQSQPVAGNGISTPQVKLESNVTKPVVPLAVSNIIAASDKQDVVFENNDDNAVYLAQNQMTVPSTPTTAMPAAPTLPELKLPELSIPQNSKAAKMPAIPALESTKGESNLSPDQLKTVTLPKAPKAPEIQKSKEIAPAKGAATTTSTDAKPVTPKSVTPKTVSKPEGISMPTKPSNKIVSKAQKLAESLPTQAQSKPIKTVVTPGINAKDLASELNKIIDKSATESRLNKHDVMILEDLFTESDESGDINLDNLVKTIEPEARFADRETLSPAEESVINAIEEEIKELDDKIRAAKHGSSKRQELIKQRKRLVVERRFNLDYHVNASKVMRDINAKSNRHIPNDYSHRELLPYVYQAIAENNIFKLGQLMEMVNNQDLIDDHGNNLVMKAAMYDNLRVLQFFTQQHGFNMHLANNYNATPLHVAANNGNYEMVKYLLGMSASAQVEDNTGRTAYEYAQISKNHEVVELFEMIDPTIRMQ